MWLFITHTSLSLLILLDFAQSLIWTHYTVLDGNGKFHLHWNPPDNKSDDSEIFFKVEMEAKGYFGLGFSPNGGMPGSDIVTGWIKDGKVYFQDRHAVDFSLPPKDEQQDYELVDANENDTFTVFEFRRKLDTCDKNDMVINESTMRVIYAYSEEDPESDDPFYHHQNRGVKSVFLLQSKYREDVELNFTSLLTWDVLSPGINISSTDTIYYCKIFKTPDVSEKHHVVYVEHMIEEDHVQFVHHMGIYECPGETPEKYEDLLDEWGYDCWQPTMPVEMMMCQGLTFAWSPGQEDMVLPEHVGFPLESGKYFIFEIHYDNPQLINGIIDHSGFRLYYTPNLREYDVGNFLFGSALLPRVFIPPDQKKYVLTGHTSPQCAPWTDSEIKVLAVQPHAHSLGREIRVRHFRGNNELIPLTVEKNCDFNYQVFKYYSKEVDILPGDQLTVECTYNTSSIRIATLGGQSTRNEMCLSFIMYYPRTNRFLSFSVPTYATINTVLGTNATSEEDITQVLGSYDWTSADIVEVEKVMRYSEQETYCYHGKFPEGENRPWVAYPREFIPYEMVSNCNDTL